MDQSHGSLVAMIEVKLDGEHECEVDGGVWYLIEPEDNGGASTCDSEVSHGCWLKGLRVIEMKTQL
jgi:hypothetical protein